MNPNATQNAYVASFFSRIHGLAKTYFLHEDSRAQSLCPSASNRFARTVDTATAGLSMRKGSALTITLRKARQEVDLIETPKAAQPQSRQGENREDEEY
jgi:hypothetical protein